MASVLPAAAANISGVCPQTGSRASTSAPPAEKRRHRLRASGSRSEMERRRSRRGDGVDVGARRDQNRDHSGPSRRARHVERPVVSEPGLRLEVRSGADQKLRHRRVSRARRVMEGAHPVALGGVHVGAFLQERAHLIEVAVARGLEEEFRRRRHRGKAGGPRSEASRCLSDIASSLRRKGRTAPCCCRALSRRGPARASGSASRSPWESPVPLAGEGRPRAFRWRRRR